MRVAVLVSHPIQYYAPLYRRLARELKVFEVFFCTRFGVRPSLDREFGQVLQYDVPLLEGYAHQFLPSLASAPGPTFWGQLNPGVGRMVTGGAFDAVIVHSYAGATQLQAILGPRPRRVKVLLRGDSNPLPRRPPIRSALKGLALRLVFSRVDRFLSAGTANTEYYQQYGVPPDRISLVPFSVDDRFFAERAAADPGEVASLRSRWGFDSEAPVFLFCGKLVPHKRALDAVRALGLMRSRRQAGLVVVGAGAEELAVRAEVERLGLASRVRMLGFVNQAALPVVYAACDGLVVPSAVEPWGLVVNEAMACGLAVATSDHVGAARDLVRDNGFTFPVGDVRALAEGLDRWAESPEALAAARLASRRIIAGWSIDATVRTTLEALAVATGAPA